MNTVLTDWALFTQVDDDDEENILNDSEGINIACGHYEKNEEK